MRCVNDTLPPRPRRRWLLTTTRLSMRSLAGIARTLVAVGTARLASMLVTMRAAGPRRGCSEGPGEADSAGLSSRAAVGSAAGAGLGSAGFLGADVAFAGGAGG